MDYIVSNFCPEWVFAICAAQTAKDFLSTNNSIMSISKKFANGLSEKYNEIKFEEVIDVSEKILQFLSDIRAGEDAIIYLNDFIHYRTNFKSNGGDRKLSDRQVKASLTNIYFAQNKIKELKEIQTSFKLSKDEVKELEQAEETIGRLIAVLKTGNISSGHQSPMYESRDNTYDPVSLEKLQMELDIPWNETPMDIYQIAKSSKAKRKDNK